MIDKGAELADKASKVGHSLADKLKAAAANALDATSEAAHNLSEKLKD